MKRRFDLIWRVFIALVVIIALAPVFAMNIADAAYEPTRPETYIDPFPAYMNSGLIGGTWLTGTSIWGAEGRNVVDVYVQIIRNSDGYRWDDSPPTPGWVYDPDTWNSVTTYGGTVAQDWSLDQWAWEYAAGPGAADLTSGFSYTVKACAQDIQGFRDETPAQRSFWYDDARPDVSFSTVIPSIVYSLTKIEGTASDDDGLVDHTRIMIQNTDDGTCWNGHFWQANDVWIKTQGIANWHIDGNSNPPLPQWQNNVNYFVQVRAVDKANNQHADPGKNFLYRHQMTSTGAFIDPIPAYVDDLFDGFSGTSRASGGRTIIDVRVEIRDTTANAYWDDTVPGWVSSTDWTALGAASWANCAGDTPTPLFGQYDWTLDTKVDTAAPVTWVDGRSYSVRIRAEDDGATPTFYISSSRTFIYDETEPGSVIDAFDGIVYNNWTSMTGRSGDSTGHIGNVIALIQRDPGGALDSFWNGAGWGNEEWGSGAVGGEWDWIFATPTDGNFNSGNELWRITTATTPGLPPMTNNMDYHVEVLAFDKAGNVETTAIKDFTFLVKLEVGEEYTPPSPPGPTTPPAPPGPTATPPPPVPTTPPAPPVPTATPPPSGPTATPPPPAPTVPPGPPVATPTPEPGFTGSGSVGTAGGTVTAKDNEGNTRVTATFESGAFSSSTAVTITGTGTCTGTPPEEYIFGNSCFDITPSQELAAKARICVYYTSADVVTAGGDPAGLKLAYRDAAGNWKVLKTTVDTSAKTLCAETKHLSYWAVVSGGKPGFEWWHWVLIGFGALLVILVIVFFMLRPRGGEEGEDYGEYAEYGGGGYEEE